MKNFRNKNFVRCSCPECKGEYLAHVDQVDYLCVICFTRFNPRYNLIVEHHAPTKL